MNLIKVKTYIYTIIVALMLNSDRNRVQSEVGLVSQFHQGGGELKLDLYTYFKLRCRKYGLVTKTGLTLK